MDSSHSGNEKYFHSRREELQKREDDQKLIPYPHKFHVSTSIANFKMNYSEIENGASSEDKCSVSGRIISWREQSKKLIFCTIRGDGDELQLVLNLAKYEGDFTDVPHLYRRGDIIGASGVPHRTRRGELSLLVSNAQLLSPCLRMLPEQGGLNDKELRFRKRHIDGIVNHGHLRYILSERAKIINFIRNFFSSRNFIEVETPSINLVAGGATARPFVTHVNALEMDAVMRISPELYLKQLVVAGFEKVFEIGKQFRNEGLDLTHNPEFTSIEAYESYCDYYDLMEMTEELLPKLVLPRCLSTSRRLTPNAQGKL
jgi:lysyl-tRNA synthetase class 2